MDAPPPRYRIVERGRRLEVIDTWAGRAPPQMPVASPVPDRPVSSAPPSTPAASPSTIRDGDPFFAMVARLACLGATDGEGRPILSTSAMFDEKAPRQFVLDAAGQQRMATSVVVAGFVLLAIAGMASDSWVFALILPLLVVLGVATKGRPLITWWLDGFAPRDRS